MGLLFTLLGLAGFCLVMWDFCQRLRPEQIPALRRWFRDWMFKGFLTPFILWMIFNSAVFHWFTTFISAATLGLFVIGTYWMALTVAWLLVVLWRQAADPREFRQCVVGRSAILCPFAILITWSFGWRFAGLGATCWILPVLHRVLPLMPHPKITPIYSRALAAIHSDKFAAAENAVIEELESFEDDFDGWMLLAELYATHFKDLPGAQNLIREICEHPATTPSQLSVACHRLADWHLKLGQDPDAARAALEEIGRRHPRSHLDHMAQLRIRQLPATREEWIASQGIKTVRLPTLGAALADSRASGMSPKEAFARSQQCVQHLQINPDDVPVRETLARLWAGELDQIDLAVEQLELLLAMPGATPAQSAEWLALMASWHLKFPPNPSAARIVLERLVRLYPQSPQAFAAQCRLNVMTLEAKIRQAAQLNNQ